MCLFLGEVSCLAWNHVHTKMTTADSNGKIVVWVISDGNEHEKCSFRLQSHRTLLIGFLNPRRVARRDGQQERQHRGDRHEMELRWPAHLHHLQRWLESKCKSAVPLVNSQWTSCCLLDRCHHSRVLGGPPDMGQGAQEHRLAYCGGQFKRFQQPFVQNANYFDPVDSGHLTSVCCSLA